MSNNKNYWLLSTDKVPLNTNDIEYWLLSGWATINIVPAQKSIVKGANGRVRQGGGSLNNQ